MYLEHRNRKYMWIMYKIIALKLMMSGVNWSKWRKVWNSVHLYNYAWEWMIWWLLNEEYGYSMISNDLHEIHLELNRRVLGETNWGFSFLLALVAGSLLGLDRNVDNRWVGRLVWSGEFLEETHIVLIWLDCCLIMSTKHWSKHPYILYVLHRKL